MRPDPTTSLCVLTGAPHLLEHIQTRLPNSKSVPLDTISEVLDRGDCNTLVIALDPDRPELLDTVLAWTQRRGPHQVWCAAPGASTAQVRALMRAGAADVIFEEDWAPELVASLEGAATAHIPSILDLLPVMVTHTSREGGLLFANQAAWSQFFDLGHTDATFQHRITDIYADPADRDTLLARLQDERVVHVNTNLRSTGGGSLPVELIAAAQRNQHDEISSIVGISLPAPDLTPLWDIVRSTNERFRQLADAITDLMVAADDKGIVTYWNKTAQTYTQLTSEQTVGRRLLDVVDLLLGTDGAPLAAAIQSGGTSSVDFSMPKSSRSSLAPGDYQARIYSSSSGTVIIGVDLTDVTRTERALRAALADRETLLREVHHRTKNNLQIITSLLNLTFLPGASPEMRSKLADIQRRVHTMALLHEQLYRGEDLTGINSRSYIRQLCQHLLSSFQTQNRVKLELSLASISLGLDTSLRTGLLLHELMVNSLKHAFPNDRSGTIRVSLRIAAGGDALELHVVDDGVGFSGPPSTGIGLQLVDSLVAQLRGTLTRNTTVGTDVKITYPWEDT